MINRLSYCVVFSLVILLFSCKQSRVRLPSLEETYSYKDKNPFGGSVVWERLNGLYDDVEIQESPVFNFTQSPVDSSFYSLYVIITKNFFVDESVAKGILDYIKDGNDVFLSAERISENFLDLIDCETNQKLAYLREDWGDMADTKVGMYFGDKLPVVNYRYFYFPFNNFIRQIDQDKSRILGVNEGGRPNYAIMFLGKGRLYLHLAPRALGNYFLLSHDNLKYLDNVFSYLRSDPGVVYWDEYFKKLNKIPDKDDDFSTLSVVIQHPALKWAFWLTIAGILFFIFTNFKRKQKVIPIQPPLENATVDFVETVGRLYFVNKDNKNIATKLITYFKEHIRSRHLIKNFESDEATAKLLAAKRGISEQQALLLLQTISAIESHSSVTDEQLTDLNKQLEQFYKSK